MFTEDYKEVLDRYETFWERTNTKRPILNISYRKEGYSAYRAPRDPEERFFDPNYSYQAYLHAIENRGYLAEGVPMLFTNFGPGCLSACIGGGFQLAPTSVWFDREQVVTDWENPPAVHFDGNSVMWKKITEAQDLYASDPRVHFSITDLGGIMDIVASLRGTENLLYDLYDYPDEVKAFSREVREAWYKAFELQKETVRATGQPYNNWMNIPSAKPWYPLQCDFCYMISPMQFREFVLDDLADQVAHMERSIYHLDGAGEIPHVDMLLDIEGLTGIQWVSGAGSEPLWDEKWFGLYRKIQDKQKNLVLLGGISESDPAGAERLIKSIDPTGVYISFNCSSKDVAEDMLEKITRWSE